MNQLHGIKNDQFCTVENRHCAISGERKSLNARTKQTDSRHLHTLHTPKGECANCAANLPTVHSDALCIDCATVQISAADLPAELITLRSLIRSTFGGGLTYLMVKTPDGLWAGGKHQGGGRFYGR